MDDGTYYLYDSSTGLFLSRGDSWHSRAVLSPAGCPLEWNSTDKTFHFLDINGSNSYLFETDDNNIYTDGTTDKKIQWELVSVDGGGYMLKNVSKTHYLAKVTPKYTEQYDFAVNQTSSTDEAIVWTPLTLTEYKAKVKERVSSFIYKKVIDETGLTCTTDKFLETLNSNAYVPSDVTSSFANSTITEGDWTVGGYESNEGNDGYGITAWNGCEAWQRKGYITRTVENLPKGIYKVSLNGFERYAGYATCNTNEAEGMEYTTSFLRANSSSVGLKSWYSDKTDTNNPNGVKDALTKFNDGKYLNEVYCYVGDDNKLQVSVNYMSANAADRWVIFNNLKVTYYKAPTEDMFTAAKKQASEALSNTLYSNVTGKEKADLSTLVNTTYADTPNDLSAAIIALNNATDAFIAAKDAYDALANENTKAKAFGITEVTITNKTTAASALKSTQDLMVKEYELVKKDYTSSVKLGDWTTTGPVNKANVGQHWDGTKESTYCEQGDNDAYQQDIWSISYTQSIALPKGDYVFKMTGRHGSNGGALANTMELKVTSDASTIGTVNDFPVGDTGLGVNKDGATSFDASDAAGFANNNIGRGWQWRYVPFTLKQETTVTFTISAAATAKYQWCSFCNYSVEAKPSVEASTVVYNQAVAEATKAKTDYTDTKGKELAELEDALKADKGTDVTSIDAATAKIKAATTAYIAANDNWKRYTYAAQAATKANVTYTNFAEDNTKSASDALTEANTLFVSALTAANTKIEKYTLGFEKDEYAPYNAGDALVTIETFKADGKVSDDLVTKADAETMCSVVTRLCDWTANTTEVNAIYDGTLKNMVAQATDADVVLPGWNIVSGRTRHIYKGTDSKACLAGAEDKSGLFVHPGTFQYGNTDGYTMPLKAGYYRASVKYCAWDGTSNNGLKLTILKKDDTEVATKSFAAASADVKNSAALTTASIDFEVKDAGDYVLSIYANGNTFMTDFYVLKATATALTLDEAATYTPDAAYANVTLKRTFVQGWNGLVLPFNMTANDAKTKFGATDIKAFNGITVDATNGTTLSFTDATNIKAGEPVLIKVTNTPSSNEYAIGNVFLPGAAMAPVSYTQDEVKYSFQGTYTNESLAGKTFSLIQGTYIYNYSGNETAVNAKTFRAYFLNENPEVSQSKLYKMDLDDIETGIKEVKRNANSNADTMYDLQGRSVKNATKGIYIKDGKKVVVK